MMNDYDMAFSLKSLHAFLPKVFPGTPSLPPTAPRRHLLRKQPTAGLRCCRVWASACGGISHLGATN